jgi:hypothetical protein
MALCAVFVFAGGLAGLSFSFFETSIPEPSPLELPEEPPAPPPLSYASVKAWVAEQERAAEELRQRRSAAAVIYEDEGRQGSDEREKAELSELKSLSEQVRTLFPEPTYTWDDTYVETCAVTSAYGCLRRTRSLEREGVSRVVRAALSGQSRAEAIGTLKVLISVLSEAPVEERASLVLVTQEAMEDTQHDYRVRLMEHEREIQRLEDEFEAMVAMYEAKIREQEADKVQLRATGLYAILGGLVLLVLVSVFLVHFAIERHLRLLQTLVERVGTTDGMA